MLKRPSAFQRADILSQSPSKQWLAMSFTAEILVTNINSLKFSDSQLMCLSFIYFIYFFCITVILNPRSVKELPIFLLFLFVFFCF